MSSSVYPIFTELTIGSGFVKFIPDISYNSPCRIICVVVLVMAFDVSLNVEFRLNV